MNESRGWRTVAPLLIGDGVTGPRFVSTDRRADWLRVPARHLVAEQFGTPCVRQASSWYYATSCQ